MNVASLKIRLMGEFRANPVKSSILAILTVVGGYLYVPMLLGVVSGDSNDSEQVAPAVTEGMPTPVIPLTDGATPREMRRWQDIAATIAADSLMETSTAWASRPSPFVTAVRVEKPKLAKAIQAPPPVVLITPSEAGLILTSTITGGRRAVALINGDAYVAGDVVFADSEFAYELVEIFANAVTLQREGERFLLKLFDPDSPFAHDASQDPSGETKILPGTP